VALRARLLVQRQRKSGPEQALREREQRVAQELLGVLDQHKVAEVL
jgi:hypothetical protein